MDGRACVQVGTMSDAAQRHDEGTLDVLWVINEGTSEMGGSSMRSPALFRAPPAC
jgi:hypothetical protein